MSQLYPSTPVRSRSEVARSLEFDLFNRLSPRAPSPGAVLHTLLQIPSATKLTNYQKHRRIVPDPTLHKLLLRQGVEVPQPICRPGRHFRRNIQNKTSIAEVRRAGVVELISIVEKVWFSLVHGLFCLNPELDHRFSSQIFLNLELDPWFRIKRVWFGFRERVILKLNVNMKGRWCLII